MKYLTNSISRSAVWCVFVCVRVCVVLPMYQMAIFIDNTDNHLIIFVIAPCVYDYK